MNDSKNTTRFFLQRDRVHTALTGSAAVVCMRAQSGILAEARLLEGTTQSALLGADSGDSVLRVKSQALPESVAYSAYGLHSPNDIPAQRPAFNGHLLVSHLYLLGNGYRGYNPVLMRFHSPDSLSPFAAGGLNCYAYCAGDPINFSDPSGHGRIRSNSLHITRSEEVLDTIAMNIFKEPRRRRSLDYHMPDVSISAVSESPLEILNPQPGWNNSGVPVQMNQQRTLTLSAAQAQPVPATSAAGPEARLPARTVSARGGVYDRWVNRRRVYSSDEIKALRDSNDKNENMLFDKTELESREIRRIAIDAMSARQDVKLALEKSRFELTGVQAKKVYDSLYQLLVYRRKRMKVV